MTFELKQKALDAVYSYEPGYRSGELNKNVRCVIVDMAEEIDCLKARIDQMEKKMARVHFGQMHDNGETES